VQALADAILAAPFSDKGWDKALRALAGATGSSRAHLIAINERHARFNWMTDAPLEYGRTFVEIEAYRPDVNYRIGAMGAPMAITFEADYDAFRQVAGTNEVYIQHARELDGEFGCQSVLMQGDRSMVGLAMLHGARDGLTTIEQRETFARCLPQALAAVRLQNAIDHQGVELLCGSLDMMRTAAVLVDGAGRVCARTEAVEKILSGGSLAIVNRQLQAAHAGFDHLLQQALGAAISMQHVPAMDLWVPNASPPMLVEVNPLPLRPWSFGFAPAAIITFRSPVRTDLLDGAVLAQALGLTRAEGDVTAMVALGQSRQAIAAARSTSVQTVNTQMRSIFQKCGVRREAELVGIALQVGQLTRSARTP
jgi:DNA-binding CsgD family transcriptional regulator